MHRGDDDHNHDTGGNNKYAEDHENVLGNAGKSSAKHEQPLGLPLGSTSSPASSMPDVTEDLSRLSMVAADDKGDTSDEELVRLLTENAESLNDDGEDDGNNDDDAASDESELDPRAARKAAKKRTKAARRAVREGRADPSHGQKDCSVCGKSVDLLIRCTIDSTAAWNMVCGKCWKDVSGGVVDGDASHPHYRYGGLWKNRVKR